MMSVRRRTTHVSGCQFRENRTYVQSLLAGIGNLCSLHENKFQTAEKHHYTHDDRSYMHSSYSRFQQEMLHELFMKTYCSTRTSRRTGYVRISTAGNS